MQGVRISFFSNVPLVPLFHIRFETSAPQIFHASHLVLAVDVSENSFCIFWGHFERLEILLVSLLPERDGGGSRPFPTNRTSRFSQSSWLGGRCFVDGNGGSVGAIDRVQLSDGLHKCTETDAL